MTEDEQSHSRVPLTETTPPLWSEGHRRAYLALGQAMILLVLPFLIYRLVVSHSNFVRNCPTQYGAIVLSLFIAGILSAVLGYANQIIFEDLYWVSKLLLFCGTLGAGVVAALTWLGLFAEQRFDQMGIFVVAFSAIAVLVSLIESRRGLEGRAQWRLVFWCVDLPLLIGCVVIVAFKYFSYNLSTEPYIALMAERFRPTGGTTPEWLRVNHSVQETIRASFWTGFAAGAITVQLLTTQAIAVALRVRETDLARRLSMKPISQFLLSVWHVIKSQKERQSQKEQKKSSRK